MTRTVSGCKICKIVQSGLNIKCTQEPTCSILTLALFGLKEQQGRKNEWHVARNENCRPATPDWVYRSVSKRWKRFITMTIQEFVQEMEEVLITIEPELTTCVFFTIVPKLDYDFVPWP